VTETTETKRYDTGWEKHEVASSRFTHQGGHRNPTWADATRAASARANDLPFGAASWRASGVSLQGNSLAPTLLSKAERVTPLESTLEAARDRLAGSRAKLVGSQIYSDRACASQPTVGCVRLSWSHAPLEEVSVIARKNAGHLSPWPSSAGQGYEVALLEFGEHAADWMLATASSKQTAWTWLKRGGGVLATWAGYGLLFGPAQYLASWIPLLGGLAGCLLSLIALGVAIAHSFTIIAVAWVAARPLLAIALLVVVVTSLVLVGKGLRERQAASKAAAASSSTPMSSRHVAYD
jgi:hypothetical protein